VTVVAAVFGELSFGDRGDSVEGDDGRRKAMPGAGGADCGLPSVVATGGIS